MLQIGKVTLMSCMFGVIVLLLAPSTDGAQEVVEPVNVTEPDLDDPEFTTKIVGSPFGEYSLCGFGGAFWHAKCTYNF